VLCVSLYSQCPFGGNLHQNEARNRDWGHKRLIFIWEGEEPFSEGCNQGWRLRCETCRMFSL